MARVALLVAPAAPLLPQAEDTVERATNALESGGGQIVGDNPEPVIQAFNNFTVQNASEIIAVDSAQFPNSQQTVLFLQECLSRVQALAPALQAEAGEELSVLSLRYQALIDSLQQAVANVGNII